MGDEKWEMRNGETQLSFPIFHFTHHHSRLTTHHLPLTKNGKKQNHRIRTTGS